MRTFNDNARSITTGITEWPRVTWLLPVLNGMPYLVEMLASLAAQTYPHGEIIAWDNGSSDETVRVLREWIPARIPGRVITGQPLGVGAARARLTELATTEFCAAVDADDVHLPMRLARQVARMIRERELAAVGCVPDIIDARGNPLPDWEYPLDDAEIRWRTNWRSCLNAPSVLVRREAVLRAGNYRNVRHAEDLDLWMRLARVGRLANLPDRLVRYRRHTASDTGTMLNFYDLDRTVAAGNLRTMFPELDERSALQLWEAAYPHHASAALRPVHLKRLHDAASHAARAVGAPADYFRRTAFYRSQQRSMVKSLLRPYAPVFVRTVARRLLDGTS